MLCYVCMSICIHIYYYILYIYICIYTPMLWVSQTMWCITAVVPSFHERLPSQISEVGSFEPSCEACHPHHSASWHHSISFIIQNWPDTMNQYRSEIWMFFTKITRTISYSFLHALFAGHQSSGCQVESSRHERRLWASGFWRVRSPRGGCCIADLDPGHGFFSVLGSRRPGFLKGRHFGTGMA
jgi:hypothetical protein